MLNRCKKNIIRDRRLKLRKLGSGCKHSMDEIDEQFLVESITEEEEKKKIYLLPYNIQDILQLFTYVQISVKVTQK